MSKPKAAIIMDPIESIKPYKDSTFAMMLELKRRDYQIEYILPSSLYLRENDVFAKSHTIDIFDPGDDWQTQAWADVASKPTTICLATDVDFVLMRKDPPFDMNYIYLTYLLELVEKKGGHVFNRPQSLRDYNEKLATAHFPQCCPKTLVSCDLNELRAFIANEKTSVLKPLDSMGGSGILKINADDPNIGSLLEMMTKRGNKLVMLQRFIPEISAGDKRILIIDGIPVDYALARIPAQGEFRGNLAAGAKATGVELSDRDRWICEQLAPYLRDLGLVFVGIDVIGDYLTEINVTSPTGIRELDKLYSLNIAGLLIDSIEKKIE